MKAILLIFGILAIAQPLFATQSLYQCFEELGNELDEHEKSLENVGFVDQDYQQKGAVIAPPPPKPANWLGDVLGFNTLVQGILYRIIDIINAIMPYVTNILTILMANKMGPDSKAIVKNVFAKMVEMYDPFLEANKKVKRILEKVVNNPQF